jgi:hypothetical protein
MVTILQPVDVSDRCFLYEALLWVGFNRFPLLSYTENGVDFRFDNKKDDQTYEGEIPWENMYITTEECASVGLPPNPEYEALINDEYQPSVETIEKILSYDIEESEKKKLRIQLEEAKIQEEKIAIWEEQFNAYTEVPISKIFLALREGRLKAFGRRLPHLSVEKSIKQLDKKSSWNWSDLEYEEIPEKFWRIDQIHWSSSAAESEDKHYIHIYVHTEELFSIFPIPAAEQTKNVLLIQGQYVLSHDAPKTVLTKNRGRPSWDWDSFYLEVSERIKNETYPEKLEAFVLEMQGWCLTQWGFEPGRSTVLQKLSPFHKKFSRK